jgi:predicted mannosyl-3-phosphoglycerate phosphatase (HAD superfamily)
MSDLKPIGIKAPLNLLPRGPLCAIAGVMEHGSVKYAPWNWQDINQAQAEVDEIYAALLRHTLAASDPSQDDFDDESGIHHLAHAGA